MQSRARTRHNRPRHRTQIRSLHEPKVGDRLGDYRLCLELAHGGMATVFLAHAPARAGLHRFVAVKCIRHELASNRSFVDMFFDEARIAAQVQHANVCSLLDFDEQNGTYFLVMEYLSGQPMTALRRELAKKAHGIEVELQTGLIARMLTDACEGLHSVHELRNHKGELLNVVHRDISPGNLFVTYDGNVKLIDFGVAYGGSEQRHKTRTGVLKGKYAYLAPELLRGAKPDRRADIWGLGVVAWELLTQRRLFGQKSEVETLGAIRDMKIPTPSSVRSDLPKIVDDIVMQALRRDPDKRCATARALGRLFNQYLVEAKLCVGLAEISEAMNKLFPEGPVVSRKMLELAEQFDDQTVAEVEAPEGGAFEPSDSFEIEEGTVLERPPGSRRSKTTAISSMFRTPPRVSTTRQLITAGGAGAAVAALALLIGQSSSCHRAARAPAQAVPASEPAPPSPKEHPLGPASGSSTLSLIEDVDPITGETIFRVRRLGP